MRLYIRVLINRAIFSGFYRVQDKKSNEIIVIMNMKISEILKHQKGGKKIDTILTQPPLSFYILSYDILISRLW